MANAIRKSLSFKKNVEPEVLEFLDKQSNYSDSILYLIQKEIAENGVRDMQLYIPSRRSIESLREMSDMKDVVNSKKSGQKEEPISYQSVRLVNTQPVSSKKTFLENNNYSALIEDELKNDNFENSNDEVPVDEQPLEVVEERIVENVSVMKNEVEKSSIEDEFGEYFN